MKSTTCAAYFPMVYYICMIPCSLCEMPTKSDQFCDHCGGYNSSQSALSAEEGLPKGSIINPNEKRYALNWRWNKNWKRYEIFLMLIGAIALLLVSAFSAEAPYAKLSAFVLGSILLVSVIPILVNKTQIVIQESQLQIKRGPIPIPFMGSFTIKREKIKRIDLVKVDTHGESSGPPSYTLKLIKDDGAFLELLDMEKHEEAIRFYRFLRGYYKP